MFRNLNLRWKMMLLLAVIVPVMAGVTTHLITSFTAHMRQAAQDEALETAHRLANKIQYNMGSAMISARSLARMSESLAEQKNPAARKILFSAIKNFLNDHPQYLGVYYTFEPNALDNRDSEFANTEFHNADGRFVPWTYRSGGTLKTDPCNGYLNDDGSGQWYYTPKRTGRETVMEPWAYDVDGKMVLMVDMVAPMELNGEFLGVVGIDFPMDTIDNFVRQIKLYDTGYAFLNSYKGAFMAHPESKKYVEGKANLFDSQDFSEELKRGIRDNVLQNKPFSVIIEEANGDQLYVSVPIMIGRATTPLILTLSVPMQEVLAEAHAIRNTAIIIGSIALLLVIVLMQVVATALVRPICATAAAVERIAEGDFSVRLPADSTDEVGCMQGHVNHMAEKLNQNMAEIREQQKEAEEKTRQAELATAEAEQARMQAVEAKREGMLAAAQRLEHIVTRVSSAAEEISTHSSEIRNGTDNQRERIATTATAMEEMNATVLEVARNAGEAAEQSTSSKEAALEGANVVNDSVAAMDKIQQQAENLTESMNQLGAQTEAIGNIIGVINDIADQTNLLALNAAIEAARAGDAGRGFAVVADEVRKLAEKTMGATKEVGESIRAIQDVANNNINSMNATMGNIASATGLANKSGAMLSSIVTGVEDSAERVQSIATAAEQQSATSEEINRAVEEINQIAMETAQAVGEAVIAAEDLATQAQELGMLINDLKES